MHKYHKRPYVYNNQHNANTWSNVTRVKPEERKRLELTDYLFAIKTGDIKESIEEELANGSKINAIKILKTYLEEAEELPTHHSLRGCKDAIDFYVLRYNLTEKLKWCRDMIEVYCNANGYGEMKNYKEVKSKKDDRLTWHYTDWEFVDDQYGFMVNDKKLVHMPAKQVLNDINNIHKKYKLPKYKKKGEYI